MLVQPEYIFYGIALAVGLYIVGRFLIWLLSLRFPYELKPSMLVPSENQLLATIEASCGKGYRVFCKLRVTDVLRPRDGLGQARRKQAYFEGRMRTLDYVVCERHNLKPRLAVSIGGSAMNRLFIAKACKRAGLKVIEVPRRKFYEDSQLEELRERVRKVLR